MKNKNTLDDKMANFVHILLTIVVFGGLIFSNEDYKFTYAILLSLLMFIWGIKWEKWK